MVGYSRIYANPDEPNHKKRHIVRDEINAVLHWIIIKPLPACAACNPASNIKDQPVRRDREMEILRQRVEYDWCV